VKLEAAGAEPAERIVEVSLKIIGKAIQPKEPNAATLSVEPSLLTFDARQGTAAPELRTFQLRGTGVRSVTLVARTRGTWLSVAPASTSLPATVTVQASPAGLAPGSYQGEIVLSGDGATERVNVSLRVREAERPVVPPPPPPEQKKQVDPPKDPPVLSKEPAIPSGTYAGPRRGVITWVGELPPGQKVTISKEGGSSGSLNRSFPGDVPIRIEVTTPGVQVETAPSASNRYARAVLVNGSGAPVSLIQIRWFVQE
jgi:hypothetical protein